MKRALFLGRFQPYHKGHQSVVEQIAREADELIIAIGSAQWSHDPANPFTAGQRIMMITRAVEPLRITTYVLPIEDIQRNALYVSHIRSLTPPFEVVYSNNPLVVQLFRDAGFAIGRAPFVERARYRGTHIRQLMLEGDAWRDHVPAVVADVIDEIGAIPRLRELNHPDTAPAF